jgi:osmotically-inducible protein OsmY
MKAGDHITVAIASSILPFVFGCHTVRSEATVKIPAIETSQDETLSRAVRDRLVSTSTADLKSVNVVSNRRVVYLTGTVMSLEARQQAAKIAWSSPGVESVVNTLQVQK